MSGNQWQFIDDVKSVVFDYLSGGYQMDDDDDYLETNNCVSIEMKGGAFLDFNAGTGYLEVNTDKCYLRNFDIQGNGNSCACTQSFYLNAGYVTFDNCKTSNRNASVDFVGFQGSATALHNYTSKYINCSVYTIDGSGKIYCFKDCYNLTNCLSYDLDSSSGSDVIYAFTGCTLLSSCFAYSFVGGSSVGGFYNCRNLTNCCADNLTTSSSWSMGFSSCELLSSCIAQNLYSTGGVNGPCGFYSCNYLSSCKATNLEKSGSSSDAWGFRGCTLLSACAADNISATGGGDAYGFYDCDYGAAIYTTETCASNTSINAGADEYSCPVGLTP